MVERLYWADIKARFGIWLKIRGCVLIHGKEPLTGKPAHYWGPWRPWIGRDEYVRACCSCGAYDHKVVPASGAT
jgi:hypothetical protein